MTLDDALKVAEEACSFVVEMEDGDTPTTEFVRLVEQVIPKFSMMRNEIQMWADGIKRASLRMEAGDARWRDELGAILARLEEGEGT